MINANELYTKACNALGQPELALKYANQVLQLDPNFSEAYYIRGVALNDLGQKQEAISDFDKAISLNPNFKQAYYGKGNVLTDFKRSKEALACFDKALLLDPSFSQAYYGKGKAFVELMRPREALICLEKGIALDPNFAPNYYLKGTILAEEIKYTEAIKYFDIALSLDPKLIQANYAKGNTLASMKRHNEAIVCFDQALIIDPNYSLAHLVKGIALLGLKRTEEGVLCFDKAISLNPKMSQSYYYKGIALVSKLKYEEAIQYFDKAISFDPEFSQVYYSKGNALVALKRTQEAIADFDRALSIDPKFSQAYYTKGNVLIDMGRAEEAYGFFTKGIELEPNNALYYCGRARCLTDIGNQQAALKDYAKAQELLKSGDVSSILNEEQIKYVEDTLKSIVEVQNMSNEAEKQMRELQTVIAEKFGVEVEFKNKEKNQDIVKKMVGPIIRFGDKNIQAQNKSNEAEERIKELEIAIVKKVATKLQLLIEEKNKISGKLVGQFCQYNNAEAQQHQDELAKLMENFQEEMKVIRAEIDKLNKTVDHLEDNVSTIKEELSTKLNNYKAKLDMELSKLNIEEQDKAKLKEYYRAFLETFSSIYVISQVIDSGKVSLDTGSIATPLLSMVASFTPYVGNVLSVGITTIGDFLCSKEMIKKARKMRGLANDSTELSQLVGKSGYEIVLNPNQLKKILQVTEEELELVSEKLFEKIRIFCHKTGDKIDAFLYTRLYKTPQARLGHMDANKLVELWINDKISPYNTQKEFAEKIVSETNGSENSKTKTKPIEGRQGVEIVSNDHCGHGRCNIF